MRISFFAIVVCSAVFSSIPPALAQTPAPTSPTASATPAPPANTIPAKPEPPSVSTARHLLRDEKYDEAAAEYKRVIEAGASAPAGYAGLAHVYLKQHKVPEAAEAAKKSVELGPNLAASHIALGEVLYRQGRVDEAAEEFRKLIVANTSDARAYYGLARVMHISSYHKKEKALIDRAYQLDPHDPDIVRSWAATVSFNDRLKALRDVVEEGKAQGAERKETRRQLEYLQKFEGQPTRPCRLSGASADTELPMAPIRYNANRITGFGFNLTVNDVSATLLLDTGAGGIIIARRIAEKAGVTKIIDVQTSGFGDEKPRDGYLGYAKNIKIGNLEFNDCYVDVVNKLNFDSEDGFIGGDVFGQFLLDIDFPNQKFRPSPLPLPPGEQPETAALEYDSNSVPKPHDRYVAPEMRTYSPFYHMGHGLILPAKVNDAHDARFFLDTGAYANLIGLQLANEVAKVTINRNAKIKGLSGEVRNVYDVQNVKLEFAHLRQQIDLMEGLDLSGFSNGSGMEIDGFLGFRMLRMLEIKIDYRDGIIDFKFDPSRFYNDPMPHPSYTH